MKELDEIKAIALEYGKREAPSILAKGEGEEAMSIIDAAFDLGLPVIEDEALQRLLSGVDIGEEIPESFRGALSVNALGTIEAVTKICENNSYIARDKTAVS